VPKRRATAADELFERSAVPVTVSLAQRQSPSVAYCQILSKKRRTGTDVHRYDTWTKPWRAISHLSHPPLHMHRSTVTFIHPNIFDLLPTIGLDI
jgi:hypothetical protein